MVETNGASALTLHRMAEAKLQGLAKHIEGELPSGIVFALMTFTTGAGGYSGWVSNGRREDMMASLEEALARFGTRTDSAPGADVEEMHGLKSRHERRAAKAEARGRKDVISRGWESFSKAVLPPTAPLVQRLEMKKAFYAGASFLFAALEEFSTGDDEVDQAMARAIETELIAFAKKHDDERKHR